MGRTGRKRLCYLESSRNDPSAFATQPLLPEQRMLLPANLSVLRKTSKKL